MPLKMPVKYVAASREKVLGNLRRAYGSNSDYPKSKFFAEKLLRETRDVNTMIDCYVSLAQVSNLIKGNEHEALTYLDKAVDLCRGLKDDTQLIRVRYMMGNIYAGSSKEDRLNAALRFLMEAEQLARKINHKTFLIEIYRRIALTLLKQAKLLKGKGKVDEALKKMDESLKIRFQVLDLEKETGFIANIANTYAGIAAVKQEQGKLDEAIEITLKFCIPLVRSNVSKGVSFFNLGDLYKDKGKLKIGLGYVLRGRAIFEGIGHAKYLAHANNVLQKELNASEILSSIDLTAEEKRIAQKRVVELKSLEASANELGVSVQKVKELEEKIIAKLLS